MERTKRTLRIIAETLRKKKRSLVESKSRSLRPRYLSEHGRAGEENEVPLGSRDEEAAPGSIDEEAAPGSIDEEAAPGLIDEEGAPDSRVEEDYFSHRKNLTRLRDIYWSRYLKDKAVPDSSDEEAEEVVPDSSDEEAEEVAPGSKDREAPPGSIDKETVPGSSDKETVPGSSDEEAEDEEAEEVAPDLGEGVELWNRCGQIIFKFK